MFTQPTSPKRGPKNSQARNSSRVSAIEGLESRTLLATSIGIYATQPNASETNPTTTGRGVFSFKRSGGSLAQPLTLHYYVRSSSIATSGSDYQPLTGLVTIAANKSSASVNLTPINDKVYEGTESMEIVLQSVSGMKVVKRSIGMKIADNDPVTPTSIGIYPKQPNASETNPTGAGRGAFTFKRMGGAITAPLTLHYYVRSSSTADSDDYVPLSGTATIRTNQRSVDVTLTPIDDGDDEPAENLTIVLESISGMKVVKRSIVMNIADNDEPGSSPPSGWFDDAWHFRTPISVAAGSFDRSDAAVDRAINFTSILSGLGQSGETLIEDSIRVVETSSDHQTVLDDSVQFQFDKASNYNATTNASGTLVFLMDGDTSAGATRYFDVYFDIDGSFSAASVTPQVTLDSNFTDNVGEASFKITTSNATYVMQKNNGGFSSILDSDDNDWVSYNNTVGSAGTYRGVPNLGVVGGGHPGFDYATATLVSTGPLKTTISVLSDDGNVAFIWEFYPTFARCTVTKADNGNYWFLYEGTPGGAFNNADKAVRSDETSTTLNTDWNDADGIGNGNDDGEWVYFNHTANNRYFFMVHNTTDNLEDSYFRLDSNMTVFGFGRTSIANGQLKEMTATPNTFTIGLGDGGDNFGNTSDLINGTYRDLSISLGSSETW